MGTNKTFRDRVTLGCVIYLFCTLGFLAMNMAGYSLFPETYGVDVSLVSTALSTTAIFGFLSSLAYTTINKKIHAKGMLYLGVAFTLAGGIGLCFLSGFMGLAISFSLLGVINGVATYTVITEVICNWFIEKRADKIALTIGAGAFGMAAYQFIGGQLFSAVGIRKGFLFVAIFNTVVLFLVTKFLIVADNPEKVGETALGAENAPAYQQMAGMGNMQTTNLYKDPVFWFGCLARFSGAAGVMFVSTYATMCFGMAGMDLNISATIVSIMTFGSAIFSLFSGKVLGIFKAKGFLAFVLIIAALCNVAMIIFGAYPSLLSIILIVLCYSVGNASGSVNNLVIDQMFAPADIGNANSKFLGVLYAGNIIYLPVSGMIIVSFGYTVLWTIMAAVNIISLVMYMIALGYAAKRKAA